MKAMVLEQLGAITPDAAPLRLVDVPTPIPADNEVLIRVSACGVCHTELDEIEGRLRPPKLPIIPGHQVVGTIVTVGKHVRQWRPGDRVGAAWIAGACGECELCVSERENLCLHFQANGRDRDGGYAEYMSALADFVFPIPEALPDTHAAPLFCAGAIGYRSLRLTNIQNGARLGLTGFGASGHLVLQTARRLFPASEVFVFARDASERAFALTLGAAWAGDTKQEPPSKLHAIIDSTPAWTPVTEALRHLVPGGRLVINAIRKEKADQSELAQLDYAAQLWLEKEVKSVANVTRKDVRDFLQLAAGMDLRPQIEEYSLPAANEALADLKFRPVAGAKVLTFGTP